MQLRRSTPVYKRYQKDFIALDPYCCLGSDKRDICCLRCIYVYSLIGRVLFISSALRENLIYSAVSNGNLFY